jgi:DHA1 family bicyclomycin/chloramphenicol resistance-like MFS transporter
MTAATEPALSQPPLTRPRGFVPFVAACMSMVALSIDTMLPAFDEIRAAFGLPADSPDASWVITAFFLGLAAGQLFFGTLSDRYGRKPLLLAGLAIYLAGAVVSVLAPTFPLLIVGRVIWGIGAAGPRSVAVAMVRDTSSGVAMARTMSFAMTIFMLVPVLAPTLGAVLLAVFPWRSVLWAPGFGALLLVAWVVRMPETLAVERRRAIAPRVIADGARTVLRTPATMWLGVSTTLMFGAMATYLGTSELIVSETYDLADAYPYLFGGIALAMAVGGLVNSRLVVRFGVRRLLRGATVAQVVANVVFAAVTFAFDGAPPIALFCLCLVFVLGGTNLVMPNANTAAMEPMGAVAGIASSILGVVMTAGGALIAALVSGASDGTVTPLAVGMLVLIVASALAVFRGTPTRPA